MLRLGANEPFLADAWHSARYRQPHKVEKTFAKLKDWRRISMRYHHCTYTFLSAICIAATVILGSVSES